MAPKRPRILFLTSNGVGLGHITRLMAIARRLPPTVEPVFFTLSHGSPLIAAAGYSVDFLPSNQGRGVRPDDWERAFQHD